MTTKQRSVLLSVLMLVLCLALVAGGTYALFTDDVTLTNHLQAGKMDITLKRTKLVTYELDTTTGYLTDGGSDEVVDFSGETTRNVFDIENGALIVPKSSYTATMEITNDSTASDVAFAYWLEIKFDNQTSADLADQLTVTVVTDDGTQNGKTTEVTLSAGQTFIGSETAPIGTLAKTKSQTFKVSVLFDDLDNNNDVQNKTVHFDLIVHAVQVVSAPST